MHMQARHRACVLLSLQPTQHSAASLGSSEMEETNVNEEVTEGFLEEVTPDRMYLAWRRGHSEGRNVQTRTWGGPEWGQRDLHTPGAEEVWPRPGAWLLGAFGGPGRGCKQWTPWGQQAGSWAPSVAPVSRVDPSTL